jgi:hypothetical protein
LFIPKIFLKLRSKTKKSVSDLKKKIEEEKPNVNIGELWKVSIPFDEDYKFNVNENFEGEVLDTTKRVIEYFSDEFPDKHVHIIVQREQMKVALFGLTGDGKSSIANMLIQGDIYREKNTFEVNDRAEGATANISFSSNEMFQVYDTVGLGEPPNGSVSHKNAVKKIRDYFSECEVPLNYIFYVKRKCRFTENDVKMFKTFKDIFKGAENNFFIIITHSNQKWVDNNKEIIKKNFGDYPILSVDFPWNEGEEGDNDQRKRSQSLRNLINEMFNKNRKGIKLEVLSSSQKTEDSVATVVDFVPIFGSVYQLISAGVYYKLGKSDMVKQRLISGTIGLALDVATLGTVGLTARALRKSAGKEISKKAVRKAISKEVGKEVGKAIAVNAGQRGARRVSNWVTQIMLSNSPQI